MHNENSNFDLKNDQIRSNVNKLNDISKKDETKNDLENNYQIISNLNDNNFSNQLNHSEISNKNNFEENLLVTENSKTLNFQQNSLNKNLAENILVELEQTKKEISSCYDIFGEKTEIDEGLILLGKLLKTLRENKDFSVLMICRKITSIKVVDSVAEIDYDDESVKQLFTNEKYYSIIQKFFKDNCLSIKLKEKHNLESDKDILFKLLDGKLIVKH